MLSRVAKILRPRSSRGALGAVLNGVSYRHEEEGREVGSRPFQPIESWRWSTAPFRRFNLRRSWFYLQVDSRLYLLCPTDCKGDY